MSWPLHRTACGEEPLSAAAADAAMSASDKADGQKLAMLIRSSPQAAGLLRLRLRVQCCKQDAGNVVRAFERSEVPGMGERDLLCGFHEGEGSLPVFGLNPPLCCLTFFLSGVCDVTSKGLLGSIGDEAIA